MMRKYRILFIRFLFHQTSSWDVTFIKKSCDKFYTFVVLLFMYTASVMYIGGIGFQSTPPLEGAGVFNVPEGDSPQNTEPPFIA